MSRRDLVGSIEAHRGRGPIDGEDVRLLLVGAPEGAPRRRVQRMVVLIAVFGIACGVLAATIGAPISLAAAGVLVGVVLGTAVVPRRDRPLALCLTTHRTLVARDGAAEADPVVELPTDAVTYVEVATDTEPFWLAGKVVQVRAQGPAGVTATLAMLGMDVADLRRVLNEAGVPHLDAPSAEPRPEVRFWLPKAFVVGLLLFVGGGFVLLAGAVLGDTGARDAVACAAVGLVLLLAGEGLRRVLFPRR